MLILYINKMKNNLINKILNRIAPVLIIKKSKFFNSKWYSNEYNIKQSNAAKHYFNIGYKKGNNPSKDFNNNLYIELYPSILDMNPLLHYELYGKNENKVYRDIYNDENSYYLSQYVKYIIKEKNNLIYIDLFLNNNSISGARSYSIQKINEMMNDNNVILLEYKQYTNFWIVSINNNYLGEFNINYLERLIIDLNIKNLYINNLAYNSKIENIINLLISVKKNNNIIYTYLFHDYLCICPSSFLLNDNNEPCANYLLDKCSSCLKNNKNSIIKRFSIEEWRKKFESLFDVVDKFIFFSEYSKAIISKVFCATKSGTVIEHKSLLDEYATPYIKPRKEETIRIAFVGEYCYPKGAKIFENTIKLLKNNFKIKTYIIGNSVIKTPRDYIVTGKYERNNLGKILSENKINLVIYPSIDNETFSYVAQELMQLNVPFTLFKCGAPYERVKNKKYNLAIVANETSADSMYQAVRKLISKI